MKTKFINEIKNKGYVEINNGELFYKVDLANEVNFPDMTLKLKQQLQDEGLYDNSYIGYISSDKNKGSIQSLPIYGNKDKYVTKWFKQTIEEVVKKDLRDKDLQLLERFI